MAFSRLLGSFNTGTSSAVYICIIYEIYNLNLISCNILCDIYIYIYIFHFVLCFEIKCL